MRQQEPPQVVPEMPPPITRPLTVEEQLHAAAQAAGITLPSCPNGTAVLFRELVDAIGNSLRNPL